MNMMINALAVIVGCSIVVFLYGWNLRRAGVYHPLDEILNEDRIRTKTDQRKTKKGLKEQFFFIAKRYGQFVQKFPQIRALIAPADLEQRLARAGNPMNLHSEGFVGVQIASMGIVALLCLYISIIFFGISLSTFLLSSACGVFGAPIALMWLERNGKKRQAQITLALPDAVELIGTIISVGLDIERAIRQVVGNSSGPLCEELEEFLNQVKIGIARQDAFHSLLWRNNSAELHTFIGALLQGQNLGVPIDQTLYEQTEIMRERRLQRAKELGAQSAPKIALITTLVIAPSIFVIFMIVMGYKLIQDFGGLMGAFGM